MKCKLRREEKLEEQFVIQIQLSVGAVKTVLISTVDVQPNNSELPANNLTFSPRHGGEI